MKYLTKKTGKGKTHIWKGDDTYCTMYSTNGMCHEKYELTDEITKKGLCKMCENNKYGNNTLLGNMASVGKLSSGAQQTKVAEIAIKLNKERLLADKEYWEKKKKRTEQIDILIADAYEKGYEDGYGDA